MPGLRSHGAMVRAVLIGTLVLIVGRIPRNLAFAANLRFYPKPALGRSPDRSLTCGFSGDI